MAALLTPKVLEVRAAAPGEGAAIAGLWRELWDAHEAWGGYTGTRDPKVYAEVARRLDEDARVRMGQPVLGRHIHLVCEHAGAMVGQVEGWFEKHGWEEATPCTCEVRSLIVTGASRARGAGRELLDVLARYAAYLARGPCVLAAEVLEDNPAQAFYAKIGYRSVSYSARIEAVRAATLPSPGDLVARTARPDDALSLARLESVLARRRRLQRDMRFDRPRAVEATLVGAIAAHLARPTGPADPVELVVTDPRGQVRAGATLVVSPLDPPFVPAKRALLGRITTDPALHPRPLLDALLRVAGRLAVSRGAPLMEITDLDIPPGILHESALATGAVRWSRVVEKMA